MRMNWQPTAKLSSSQLSKMKVTVHGDALPSSREFLVSGGDKSAWNIPEEVPVAFVYNRRNYAVLMATPGDLVDFAVGFTLTERVVDDVEGITSIDVYQTELGVDLRFKIDQQALEKLDIVQRRRNLIGSASCGLCGLENADSLFKKLPRVIDIKSHIDISALEKAMSGLRPQQILNEKTHSVHAAAWSTFQGDIIHIREDVGRHNALDKLLGTLARNHVDIQTGFLLMSSRCSYEIVEKAASLGVTAIASISGPTAFALRKAKEANILMYSSSTLGPIEVLPGAK